MNKEAVNKWVLLLVVLLISATFLAMIRQFIMAIVLAGLFAGLSHPFFRRINQKLGDRPSLASFLTILIILCVVFVPLLSLLGIVTAQAIKVTQIARPWLEARMAEPAALSNLLEGLPFVEKIEPYRNEILTKAGELVSGMAGFIINQMSSVTLGTVNFIFTIFIMLYCLFFFLIDGGKLLNKILYYLPLEDHDEQRILEKFVSVTRATLKGTLAIGAIQGTLAGLAFAVAGIPSAVFWGTVMTVLSIIPSIGSALIWFPAAAILAVTGHVAAGIGLGLFCAIVVGSLDNLLRPVMVGKDTQMHELMIFFGTLGGIFMFGVAGIIIGPIVAALFVTVWDIYGIAFADILPAVKSPFGENGVLEEDDGSD